MNKIISPCPFCGNSKDMKITTRTEFEEIKAVSPLQKANVMIQCYSCNVVMRMNGTDYDFLTEKAIDVWNDRNEARKDKVVDYDELISRH